MPDGPAGQKPFALLHRAMSEHGLCCVANVVLHNREQLVLVRPLDDLLCMTVLRYSQQVKTTAAFDDELVETDIPQAEFDLATTLIAETTIEEFDLEQYHDQYTKRLTTLIEAKVTGQEIVESPAAEGPNVINLMEALKASVAKAQGSVEATPAAASSEPEPKSKSQPAKGAKKRAAPKSDQILAEQLKTPTKRKKKTANRKKRTG